MDPYTIRAAVLRDGAVIARHRVAMFTDMGEVAPNEMCWTPGRQ